MFLAELTLPATGTRETNEGEESGIVGDEMCFPAFDESKLSETTIKNLQHHIRSAHLAVLAAMQADKAVKVLDAKIAKCARIAGTRSL